MNAPPPPHPTNQTLRSYGLGKLDGPSAKAVDSHLRACPDCRRKVGEVSSDSFLGRLRDVRTGPETSNPSGSLVGGSFSFLKPSPTGPPPADTLPPGLADHDDYEIRRELGRGGMGVVYLAHNRMMGRDEVLKVMGRNLMERPGVLDRFLREIRSVAKLRHPNIVTAYSAFRLDGGLVFAMEYIDGLDLSKLVKAKGPLAVAHAALFTHQAALGLQHAHEKGTVHRDIKPHNLMLTHDGKLRLIKILDFGLAKASREEKVDSALTSEGQALGTPDYIAPEQILNATGVDIRADLYSLGATLFFLLTGRPPFKASSLYDLYQAHISRDIEPLNLLRPEVPSELSALVSKMMAKDPDRRFQTPGELAEALTPFYKPAGNRSSRPAARENGDQAGPKQPTADTAPTPASQRSTPGRVVFIAGSPRPEEDGADWKSLVDVNAPPRSAPPPLKPEPPGPEPTPQADEKPAKRSPWDVRAIAVGVLAFGLILALVLAFRTRTGTIVFENLPEHAEVVADAETCLVTWPEGEGQGRALVTVPAGRHDVQVSVNGVKVTGREVVVESGGETPFVVRFEPAPEALASTPKPVGAPPEAPTRPTEPPGTFTVDKGVWFVQGDELVQAEGRVHWPCLLFGDDQWTDYDFSADLMRVHGQEAAYLVVRAADKDNNLVFTNSGWGGTRTGIEVTENGSLRALRNVGRHFESLKWYTARVRVRGSEVVATLLDGDKEVARVEVNDNAHPKGRVGLRTWWSSYRFKSIKVTAPDGKTLWEGPPAVGPPPRPVGPAAPADPYRAGWVSLFNGRDLSGWAAYKHGYDIRPAELFFVDRNELASYPGNWGTLVTEDAYSDFIATVDYHIGPGEDAGLILQSAPGVRPGTQRIECQIMGEQPNDYYGCGDVYAAPGVLKQSEADRAANGQLYHRSRRADIAIDGWNTYEVRSQGRTFTVKNNGVEVNKVESLVDGPWRVGLNAEGRGSVRFRNLAIKGLGGNARPVVKPVPAPVAVNAPAPPVSDDSLALKRGDLITSSSDYRYQLDDLRNGSLKFGELEWSVYESKGRFFGRSVFGHKDLLLTHPFNRDNPAKIDLSKVTRDRSGELTLMAHSIPDILDGGGRIVVKVDDRVVHDSLIRHDQGWKTVPVPFDRAGVVVEHYPMGWSWEYVFFDFALRESGGTRPPARDPDKPSDRPDADGYVSLFNGKDLDGWKTHTAQPGNWRVVDGVLTGSGSGISHLYTTRGDYKDVSVRARVRVNVPGSGGVYARSSFGPKRPAKSAMFCDGYEAAVNCGSGNPNKTGSLYGPTGQSVVSVPKSPANALNWMTLEIMAKGGRVLVTVDGKVTADYTDPKPPGAPAGHIALLQYRPETVIEFSRIEVKELDPSRAGPRTPAVPSDAVAMGGHFYKVFEGRMSWHAARDRCRSLGGRLAVVTGRSENDFLTALTQNAGVTGAWLGATDERVEGQWVWVDGSPLRYANWDETGKQPNNKQGREHYLVIVPDRAGTWCDQPDELIDAKALVNPGFVCEW